MLDPRKKRKQALALRASPEPERGMQYVTELNELRSERDSSRGSVPVPFGKDERGVSLEDIGRYIDSSPPAGWEEQAMHPAQRTSPAWGGNGIVRTRQVVVPDEDYGDGSPLVPPRSPLRFSSGTNSQSSQQALVKSSEVVGSDGEGYAPPIPAKAAQREKAREDLEEAFQPRGGMVAKVESGKEGGEGF